MKQLSTLVLVVLTICYPFAVYFGLNHFNPAFLAVVLMTLLIARLFLGGWQQPHTRWALLIAIGVLVWVSISNQLFGLKLYPVVISFSMLAVFGWSLRYPPSIIERIARRMEKNFPAEAVIYTRKVTIMWCVFFSLNGLIALYTALWSDLQTWTLYNGLISYLIMGSLFIGEWLVRQKVKRAHHG